MDTASADGDLTFAHVTVGGPEALSGVTCRAAISCQDVEFPDVTTVGPVAADRLLLEGGRFGQSVEVRAGGGILVCRRTRFDGGVSFRLRKMVTEVSQASFVTNSSISGEPVAGADEKVGEWRPLLVSLAGTDVSNLSLTDVNLAWCQFAGAHRLDQLRIEGRCDFNQPPGRTPRQTVAEEHFWRGWTPEHPYGVDTSRLSAERLAAVYRSLRKALEDGKNEAGAGDFYYGEMEARRHAGSTSHAEKAILWCYWLLSGYGQRAARAVAGLGVLLATVIVLLVMFGLPSPATQRITGTVGSTANLEVVEPAVGLPPVAERATIARVERATQISLGAIVFRDANQRLTTAGSWTVTIARILGPLLIALAVLAVRARVKR